MALRIVFLILSLIFIITVFADEPSVEDDVERQKNDTDDIEEFDREPDFSSPKFDKYMRSTIAEEFGEPVPAEYTGKAYYYYYFKIHDEDKNGKLDKKELLQALIQLVLPSTDYQRYNHADASDDEKENGIPYELELLCLDSVDRMVRKDDKNKDGFIDAVEYQNSKSRGLKAIKKAIDKQLKNYGLRGRY